ncbi:MAG TPA: RNA polymerase sigma factor [Patescibacteria group bacterium]|jgi:RNA polymerase sigma-70 factor (ECF subfamily)|nr:RNA polymerase sigma factor [Patescibacteria group bacterium]
MIDDEITDEAISRQVQDGNIEIFGILVERYEPKLQRYAKRFLLGHEDAQDIVQEVFLKAYTNMQSFDATQRFSPWIYRIAHNEFINSIKKKGREPLSYFDPDTLFPHPVAKEQPEKELHSKELKDMLDKCLDKLDPKYREPLVLYYYEDLDYQSIADILRIPTSTVGVRLNRGKVALQKIYSSLHN